MKNADNQASLIFPMVFPDPVRQAVGKIRRFYICHFRKGYLRAQLELRQGECRQCAACCRLLFSCAALGPEQLCRIYHGRRWAVCRVFPIDRRDIEDVSRAGGSCGYYFLKS